MQEEWHGEVIHLSWRPRAFLYKRFLTDEECDHVRNKVCAVGAHGCRQCLQAQDAGKQAGRHAVSVAG